MRGSEGKTAKPHGPFPNKIDSPLLSYFLQYVLVGLEFSAPLAKQTNFLPEEIYLMGAFN
jgi:hypothetical protein